MATTGSPDTAWCIACASAAVALCGNATDGLIHKLPPRCWVVAHRANADKSALHGPSANTNVIAFAGRTLALVEGGAACAELSENLETIDVWTAEEPYPAGNPAIRSPIPLPAISTRCRNTSGVERQCGTR